MSLSIDYVICFPNTTSKTNIIYLSSIKCKRVTRSVLVAELYGMMAVGKTSEFLLLGLYDSTDLTYLA